MAEHAFFIGAARHEAPALAPGLYLTATPIGNLGDITLRALATLAAADVVLCEDTRVTVKVLQRYGIKAKLRSYHEHNEAAAGPAIIAALNEGAAYALVSDAGMPLISDPGQRLVRDCVEAGIVVTSVPGASSVLAALSLSALPAEAFCFIGFLPHKSKARRDHLAKFASVPATLIAFESPHRVVEALHDMTAIFPNRTMALARELTKLHEEVLRGTPGEMSAVLAQRDTIKGEICLVISPPAEQAAAPSDEQVARAISLALQDHSASKAASLVAKQFGLPKDEIYARILKQKNADA